MTHPTVIKNLTASFLIACNTISILKDKIVSDKIVLIDRSQHGELDYYNLVQILHHMNFTVISKNAQEEVLSWRG